MPKWLGGATGGGLAVLALVVFILPASAGAAPFTVIHTTKVVAPFKGATGVPSMSTSTTGCASATIVTAPFFQLHTGDTGFSGTSAARLCHGMPTDYGVAGQSETLTVPFPVTGSARHIDVKWTVNVDGGAKIHVGTCTIPGSGNPNTTLFAECDASAQTTLSAYFYIYDATNGSYYLPTNTSGLFLQSFASYYDYCYDGSCFTNTTPTSASFSFGGPLTQHFAVHGLNATHVYELVGSFYGAESSDVEVYGPATLTHTSASSWLNFGTFGNGATLNSIAVW